jgi:hypothetical protein
VHEQLRIPADDAHLVAALAVRRDVQAIAAATAEPPTLSLAIHDARLALIALNTMGIGSDQADIYRRLVKGVVSIEHVATSLRVAYPDLILRSA